MTSRLTQAFTIGVLCLVSILTLSNIFSGQAYAADTVKIGLLEVMSGPIEFIGRSQTAAVQFVVDEQNAKGGLLGKKIEILVEDSEFRADVAIRKAKKMILEQKVDFLGVGSSGEAVAMAVSGLATQYKKNCITFGPQSMELTGKEFGPYTFRVCQNMHNIVVAQSLVMKKSPHRKYYTMAMDVAGAIEHTRAFKEAVKLNVSDAVLAGEEYFAMGTTDFAPYITKIKAANPDIIMLAAFGGDMINFVKQSLALGLKAPMLTFSAVDPYLMKELGDQADGMYYVNPYTFSVQTPENQALIAGFHEKHKDDKDFYLWWPHGQVGQSITGWRMFFAAIEKAGTFDQDKIVAAFEGFRYKAPMGWIEMRKCDHQLLVPMFGGTMVAGMNDYFNGSIRSDVKFPWESTEVMTFPIAEVANPATSDYNPRCR